MINLNWRARAPTNPGTVPVPTLDTLSRDLSQAASLSTNVRAGLIAQAAAVVAALGAGLADQGGDSPPDRLITVKEASSRLGLTEDYLYRHARDFPFFVQPNGARAVRFSERGIERYLRQQQQQ